MGSPNSTVEKIVIFLFIGLVGLVLGLGVGAFIALMQNG